jgi:hypothetical protein
MDSASGCARAIVAGIAASVLIACGGDSAGPAQTSDPGSSGNSAPVISGTPPTTARVGEPYSFRPVAMDGDGDALSFTAVNLPLWASIEASTGRIAGTPRAGDEGTHAGIRVSVSDGEATASLSAFSISVSQNASGTATVSWLPPTENEDGTPLTDLAGFRIEYGRDGTDLDQAILIDNPSINTYMVERLSSGTWYFAVIALSARGIESRPSSLASKTIG